MRNKVLWTSIFILSLALVCVAFTLYNCNTPETESQTHIDSIVYDTIKIKKPIPVDSVVLRYKIVKLPVAISKASCDTAYITTVDSVEVSVPITQKEYSDTTYHAWVSGYLPNLDSIKIYRKKTYQTTVVKKKPSRWGIGPQVGIGFGNGKCSPYIGLGIHYDLFSW